MGTDTVTPSSPLRLLRHHGALSRLIASMFITGLGGAMTTVGLPLFVVRHYGLGLSVGFALGARLLPNILLGVFVGNVVDRFQPRRVAIVTALASAALAGAIPFTSATWQLSIISFLGGVGSMFGYPARIALRPLVMPAGAEVAGNSVMVTTERLSSLIGPLCAGPIIIFAGLNWLFGFEAITAVAAGLLMLGLPDRPVDTQRLAAEADQRPWQKAKSIMVDGMGTLLLIVRRDRMLLGLTITAFTYVAAVAVGQIFLTKYSLTHFPSIQGGFGYLMAAMGLGGVVGGMVAGRLGRFHQGRLYFWGNILEGFCWLALPVVGVFAGSLALIFLAGCFESVATVVYFAEAQKRLPQEYSGRFYGVFLPMINVFIMLGTTLGAPTVGAVGVGWSALVICLLVAAPVLACAAIFLVREVPSGMTEASGHPR